MHTTLSVRSVGKKFDGRGQEVVALDNIDLEVEAGGFGAIVGPSGCGKSTLLRIMADLLPPSSGTVWIGDEPPRVARRSNGIGFVFQSATQLPWRTVRRNIELPLDVVGHKAEHAGRAEELIDLVGLNGFADALPSELSGGMQQRAAIARALILKPQTLFLDEPFGALDEITRNHMNLELLRIWSETATTAMLVTHSISEAVLMADKVFVMSARPGRIVKSLTIGLPRPRTLEMMRTDAFFGAENELREALYGSEVGTTPRPTAAQKRLSA